MVNAVETDGFVVHNSFFNNTDLDDLYNDLSLIGRTREDETSATRRFAERNILVSRPAVRELAASPQCLSLAGDILGPGARAVKATLFNKTPVANWKVPPHQDVTIAVQKRIDTPGFGPWSLKADVTNVQPPVEILQGMVAFRIHLDVCGTDNGALKVWPGSHVQGRLLDVGIEKWISSYTSVICPVARGGLMVMRPLLIHASSRATIPTNRRVIHIEYAAQNLPNGLCWLSSIA